MLFKGKLFKLAEMMRFFFLNYGTKLRFTTSFPIHLIRLCFMNNPARDKSINISAFIVRIGKDDIIRARVKDYMTVTLKHAREMTDTLMQLTPDASRPVMIDLGKIKYITKEARDHFKTEKRQPTAPAVALIIKSKISIIIGNFYLALTSPIVPTRLFRNEKSAAGWLKKIL